MSLEPRRREAPCALAAPQSATASVSLREWLEQDGDELVTELERLYVPRQDSRWLRRNALVAAGNVGTSDLRPAVERYAEEEDEVLRDAAEWALQRMNERSA